MIYCKSAPSYPLIEALHPAAWPCSLVGHLTFLTSLRSTDVGQLMRNANPERLTRSVLLPETPPAIPDDPELPSGIAGPRDSGGYNFREF